MTTGRNLKRAIFHANLVALGGVILCGCVGIELQARLNNLDSNREMTATDCSSEFPEGVAVDLLAGDSIGRYFAEIQENNSPTGGWKFEGGVLTSVAGGPYQHLITKCPFTNFDLEFSWKISPAGNSGVKYLVDPTQRPIGLEYQILDDEKHPDAKKGPNRQSAALYDLYPANAAKKLNPPGAINKSMIVMRGNRVQHWLNGDLVLEFERGTPAFRQQVQLSKFKKFPHFGEQKSGHILLQHHSDVVKFVRIMITAVDAE